MYERDILVKETKTCFEPINFGEISERWIDDVIDNEFNDVEENQMSACILFCSERYSPTEILYKVCSVCEKWNSVKAVDIFDDSDMSSVDNSSVEENVLWTSLKSFDVSVKQIQGIVYFLCFKANKTSSSLEDKKIGLLSAKFYFSCLRVPGSSAYNVFHPNLFRICIDSLQMPSHTPETKDTVYTWRDFQTILPDFISTLDSLIPLLSDFHLGSDITTTEYVIQKLTEIFACEASNNRIDFASYFVMMNKQERRRRYSETCCVTCLASQGLLILANSNLNGEKESNCAFILSGLNMHISCSKIKKATNIPHKFIVIRDNAVAFIKYALQCNVELFSKPVQTTLKRLCLLVCDKVDFRATVSGAIYSLMFGLEKNDLVDLIQWLLLLVDSSETNNRNFALEILGLLLSTNRPVVDGSDLPDSSKVYLTLGPLIFAILTRCDDCSSVVRSKALTVVSQHIKIILDSLLLLMDDTHSTLTEDFEDDIVCDMNGDHRAYWYNLGSYREVVDEIASILHRRCEDEASAARKSAYQALENLLVFDSNYLTEDFFKLFVSSARDENTTPRKQVIQSLTIILDTYPDNSLAQDFWLKCVTPLVNDPEITVQAKALSVMEERFLRHIFSSSAPLKNCVFSLLEKLSHGKYLSHKRYLQKSFSHWKTEKKLGSINVATIEKCFGHGRDESVWFYLSIYAGFSKLPTKLTECAVEEFQKSENWSNAVYMENLLKLLSHSFFNLSSAKLENITGILTTKLQNFSAQLETFPLLIEVLKKLEKHLQNNKFSNLVENMMQGCIKLLKAATEGSKENAPSDELIAKSLTIVKEFCHIFPNLITLQLKDVLKPFRSIGKKSKRISPVVRAHAFACVGKIAIQDEKLAKEIIPDLAYQLLHCQEDATRNNVAIIMIDMCKRYTSLADQYVSIISRCFQDKRYLIRYQAITMIVNLLQEGYIKSKGTLFYCLLTTIIDKNDTIQELGKYCLCNLLLDKKSSVFTDHFTDSFYIFNGFPHPTIEYMPQLIKEFEIFDLKGQKNQDKRVQMYKFMLACLDGGTRVYAAHLLISNILHSVAGSVIPLNSETENMVRDCFIILTSQETRVITGDQLTENEEDEEKLESLSAAEKEARKYAIVEPLIPVIISLKNCAKAEKSQLAPDIILFLKDLLYDYKNELPTLLASDKILENQIQFEFKRDMIQQGEEVAIEENKEGNKKQDSHNTDIQNPTSSAVATGEKTACLEKAMKIIQRESSVNGYNPQDSFCLTSKTPQNRFIQKSKVQIEDMEVDPVPSTSNAEPADRLPQYINSSTPLVLLTALKLPETPDVSSLVFHVDSD